MSTSATRSAQAGCRPSPARIGSATSGARPRRRRAPRAAPRAASSSTPARLIDSKARRRRRHGASSSRAAKSMATRLARQPPRREEQRVRRGRVEPLRVVDEHEQRRRPRPRPRAARSVAAPIREAVDGRPGPMPERVRPALAPDARASSSRLIEQRPADVEERRELELAPRTRPRPRARRVMPLRARGRVVEQRGLADARPRRTQHDARSPRPAPAPGAATMTRTLAVPADQHEQTLTPHGVRSHFRRGPTTQIQPATIVAASAVRWSFVQGGPNVARGPCRISSARSPSMLTA